LAAFPRVGFEIKCLSNLIKRKMAGIMPEEVSREITGMQGVIIGHLYRRRSEDTFQRDIEAKFNIRRSTATGILNLMEEHGLIKREPVEYDARLKKLVLTEKAVSLHKTVSSNIDKLEKDLVRGIAEEELRVFFDVASKIRNNLESDD